MRNDGDLGRIELLVLDVDGVLTDGRIILTPGGEEVKAFHARDGAGMKYWQRAGLKLAIITGRGSPAVELRARELAVDSLRINATQKLPVYQQVLAELGVSQECTAVVGDDLVDLPMMRHCGFAVAVADAVEEVRCQADLVTTLPGGRGAVREVIEHILRRTGAWEGILRRYDDPTPESRS